MPIISKNMSLGRPLKLSGWRKIALGTWTRPGDPSIHALVPMEVAPALAYIEKLKQRTGMKVTLTHFLGKAMAVTIARHPDVNVMLRWGRLYPRKTVDVFFQVASDPEGRDLTGVTVREADRKSLAEISAEMTERVRKIKEKGDADFAKMKKTMSWTPGWFTRYILDFASFFMYTLNLWSPLLGSPRDPFGSIMITSVGGALGLDVGFPPLVPYSRIPLLIALGIVKDTPIVKDGQLAIAPMVNLSATIDHRVIDGVHGAKMLRTLKKIMAEPEAELGAP